MKTESVDLDDTNSNEDWIKEVTRKREASQRAGQVTPSAGKSLERMRKVTRNKSDTESEMGEFVRVLK